MKKTILIALCVVISGICNAADYRMWTDTKTGKSITAEILDKKIDNSSVKIHIRGGKTLWLDVARLVKDDRDFVADWVKPVDHLSARVIGSRKGGIKKLKVSVNAGSKEMKVVIQKCVPSNRTITKLFTMGETTDFEIEVYTDYIITAYEGEKGKSDDVVWGEVVDTETHRRKTGL